MFNIFSWISHKIRMRKVKQTQKILELVLKMENGDEHFLNLMKEIVKDGDNPEALKKVKNMSQEEYLTLLNDAKRKVEAMETINRISKQMEAEGLITIENKKIKINDLNNPKKD